MGGATGSRGGGGEATQPRGHGADAGHCRPGIWHCSGRCGDRIEESRPSGMLLHTGAGEVAGGWHDRGLALKSHPEGGGHAAGPGLQTVHVDRACSQRTKHLRSQPQVLQLMSRPVHLAAYCDLTWAACGQVAGATSSKARSCCSAWLSYSGPCCHTSDHRPQLSTKRARTQGYSPMC